MELLRRRFGTKRVHANIVYQEYIGNKEHVHMNSTQWETLTEFVKWMGREGVTSFREFSGIFPVPVCGHSRLIHVDR